MKLKEHPRLELLYEVDNLIIPMKKGQTHVLNEFLRSIEGLNLDKDYEVVIKQKRHKRSLDANAYCWVLIGKLGAKLKQPDTLIYRQLIKDNGVSQIVPIREDAIDQWVENWKRHGLGWICDDLGPCRNLAGYHNLRCYYGSSVYDTAEMARLIDAVVWECKEQGIETMTPEEIERMKAMWKVT